MSSIHTDRLLLRSWKESDIEAFAHMSMDPKVGEFFSHPLSKEKYIEIAKNMKETFQKQGWGVWVLELPGEREFIGSVGLSQIGHSLPIGPAIQLGWRLDVNYWNLGFATEAAKAVLEYAFQVLNLEQVVSFTDAANAKSRHIMEKIGMKHAKTDDFNYPDHPFKQQAVYRIFKDQ